jgi:hypothetical protein
MNDLDKQLVNASIRGDLDLVKKLISKGVNIHYDDDYALRYWSFRSS